MKDLILDKDHKRGSRGKKVRAIQEWLSLHGFSTAVDGDFGPATDYAVREFQRKKRLKVDGIVGEKTFNQLIRPITNVLRPIASANKSPGEMVVLYAEQHLMQHPREIGGQNKGPWVRLYMKGNEGPAWPWCAGFVSFILKQACESLNMRLPIKTSFSCDVLATNAQEKKILLKESKITDKAQITTGSFFLVRRTPTDWVHTGIVIRADEGYFHTVEGNTNDEGSREGYEVCKRTRGYRKKDFVLI